MLFFSLPKSRAATEKAAKLSSLELQIFDMHITAALLRPDSHARVVEYFRNVAEGINFEFLTLEIDVAIVMLTFHPKGGFVCEV